MCTCILILWSDEKITPQLPSTCTCHYGRSNATCMYTYSCNLMYVCKLFLSVQSWWWWWFGWTTETGANQGGLPLSTQHQENITKPMTSTTDPCTHMHDPSSSSSQKHCSKSAAQTTDKVPQKKESITLEAKNTFKSPTGVLAGDLSRNLSIKSPSLQTPKLTALPKHMQVAQLGSKAELGRNCFKGSSLLTSTAMRFQSGNDGLNSILDGSPDPIPG